MYWLEHDLTQMDWDDRNDFCLILECFNDDIERTDGIGIVLTTV